jgi:hypothetical protein
VRRRLRRKRLIFTVTAGRTGTEYLARILECAPGVSSHHEPHPKFSDVMRAAQADPRLALRFLSQLKLPHIASIPTTTYVETSHLFAKGFLEPIVQFGLIPDLILLSRPARDVASSLYLIGAIPGRSTLGSRFLLEPSDPGVVQLRGSDLLHDYQLCFWYVMEMERRQRVYEQLVSDLGGRTIRTSLSGLASEAGFFELVDALHFERPSGRQLAAYVALRGTRVNRKTEMKRELARILPDGLDALESEVHALVAEEPVK